jgi:hypothetical protein
MGEKARDKETRVFVFSLEKQPYCVLIRFRRLFVHENGRRGEEELQSNDAASDPFPTLALHITETS